MYQLVIFQLHLKTSNFEMISKDVIDASAYLASKLFESNSPPFLYGMGIVAIVQNIRKSE